MVQGGVGGVGVSPLPKQEEEEEEAEVVRHPSPAAASEGACRGLDVIGESGVGHPFSGAATASGGDTGGDMRGTAGGLQGEQRQEGDANGVVCDDSKEQPLISNPRPKVYSSYFYVLIKKVLTVRAEEADFDRQAYALVEGLTVRKHVERFRYHPRTDELVASDENRGRLAISSVWRLAHARGWVLSTC